MANHGVPWTVREPDFKRNTASFAIDDAHGERVCAIRLYPRTVIAYRKARARAELIARSVNSIDDLLTSIDDLAGWLDILIKMCPDESSAPHIASSITRARAVARKAIGA